MASFWIAVAKRTPRAIWSGAIKAEESVNLVALVVSSLLALFVLFLPELKESLKNAPDISRVWALAAVGPMLIWGVARAVYAEHLDRVEIAITAMSSRLEHVKSHLLQHAGIGVSMMDSPSLNGTAAMGWMAMAKELVERDLIDSCVARFQYAANPGLPEVSINEKSNPKAIREALRRQTDGLNAIASGLLASDLSDR